MAKPRVKALLEGVDNYVNTVATLVAFIHESTWDTKRGDKLADARYAIGRRMTTSAANRISPASTVTPDAVVQRSPAYGLVCEVKTNIAVPADGVIPKHRREDIRKQVLTYDDPLVGWFTRMGGVSRQDVVLICDINRAQVLKDLLDQLAQTDGLRSEVVIVATVRRSQVSESVFMMEFRGSVADHEWDAKLRRGITVGSDYTLASKLGQLRFCDAPPDSPLHTMLILWDHVFMLLLRDRMRGGPAGGLGIDIPVNVAELTKLVQSFYGCEAKDERDTAMPDEAWIRDALEMFVNIGKAEKTGSDTYSIHYCAIRRELAAYFATRIADWERKDRARVGHGHPKQTGMFDQPPDHKERRPL